jgi:NAD(P)-dependent dehydrogenase (short-subunit alcohol dehydrogenase family)
VAVVTGAAGGIGLALCEAFAAQGMRVVMADVDPGRLRSAADAIDGDVEAVPTDASRWDDVERLARRTVVRFGEPHVLCNNAGVTLPGLAWEFTLEEWDWVLAVNVRGVVHGIKAFVPGMIERGGASHVVNTASIGGLLAFPSLAMYCASKYAVVGLSESLRHDLRGQGHPIGVSVLCPGPTETDLRRHSRRLKPGADEPDAPGEYAGVTRISPAQVAAETVEAIRSDRFWILTHPTFGEAIERRARGIVDTDEVVVPVYQ